MTVVALHVGLTVDDETWATLHGEVGSLGQEEAFRIGKASALSVRRDDAARKAGRELRKNRAVRYRETEWLFFAIEKARVDDELGIRACEHVVERTLHAHVFDANRESVERK